MFSSGPSNRDMKNGQPCPKCGSKDILADVRVEDKGRQGRHDLELVAFGNPNALIFTERQTTSVSAWVCGSCGYVDLYAKDVEALRTPYNETNPRPTPAPEPTPNLDYHLRITRAGVP